MTLLGGTTPPSRSGSQLEVSTTLWSVLPLTLTMSMQVIFSGLMLLGSGLSPTSPQPHGCHAHLLGLPQLFSFVSQTCFAAKFLERYQQSLNTCHLGGKVQTLPAVSPAIALTMVILKNWPK